MTRPITGFDRRRTFGDTEADDLTSTLRDAEKDLVAYEAAMHREAQARRKREQSTPWTAQRRIVCEVPDDGAPVHRRASGVDSRYPGAAVVPVTVSPTRRDPDWWVKWACLGLLVLLVASYQIGWLP